jgi:hypothetical protein
MIPDSEKNLELDRLNLERQRFQFERQGVLFRYVAIVGAAATFVWGAFQYFHGIRLERDKQRAEQESATAVQKIAASEPFLSLQLKLFQEATKTAAFLATMTNAPANDTNRQRFEQLYWGELALVEKGDVAGAMVKFRDGLVAGVSPDELQHLSLEIAHACRIELGNSWAVSHWLR